MLSKNNKKTLVATLVITTLSLSMTSWITISAPNYASAQVSSQNATTTVGDGATQGGTIGSGGAGGAGTAGGIMTGNETTTEGGTIGSGGAGGAGTAGGIMTGEDTRTHNSTS
jgi:hypothetical protein